MTAAGPGRRNGRPLVAVVHDQGSAAPLSVRSAAGRACDVVFVCDFDRPPVAADREVLSQVGGVVDVTGLAPAARARALADLGAGGITTFSEHRIRETADLAERLGLAYHPVATASVLTDKFAQRARLAAAGVDSTRCALLAADPADRIDQIDRMQLPVVVKPRVGAGSTHTYRAASAPELAVVLADLPGDREFVVESLLAGTPSAAGEGWGDYVSVESVHTPEGSRPVCVTGKFPLVEPFRESGMVLPSTLDERWTASVLELEATAVTALGVTHGITHTEIKLTPDGPRLIEVNGRLGGYVPEILRRASGIDLVRIALELALGRPVTVPVPVFDAVTYQYFLLPGWETAGVLATDLDLESLTGLPGVLAVQSAAVAGRRIDWREGTQGHLGVVLGSGPDHASVVATAAEVDAVLLPRLRAALATDDVEVGT